MVVFAAAITYQIFHWVEHVAQVYQHWWLGLSVFHAHGILFFFDLEWNHFTFNTLYLIGLWVVFIGARRWWLDTARRTNPFAFYSFLVGGLGVQSYHQLEHVAKISQHLNSLCEPCPGILGWYLDGIYLHFTLNTIVLAFPLAAFLAYGLLKRLIAVV